MTRSLALALGLILSLPATAEEITMLPDRIEPSCRAGQATLYDECGSQTKLFRRALSRASAEGKTLLVSYGAEWCIWCHVFEQYIKGEHTRLTYRFSEPGEERMEEVTLSERPVSDPSAEAAALNAFVAETFVVVHIEDYHSADGYDVLIASGADAAYAGGLPFIFTVSADGRYAAQLESTEVETRRDGFIDWYRGYDRPSLMAALTEMDRAARQPAK